MLQKIVKNVYHIFKGGTTGQVWKKLSNLDYDMGWGDTQSGSGGPLVYRALLTQSEENAPTAIVLENTLGGEVVWTRVGSGDYRGTLNGVFLEDKTFLSGSSSSVSGGYMINLSDNSYTPYTTVSFLRLDDNQVSLRVTVETETLGGEYSNYIFKKPIEILVYP